MKADNSLDTFRIPIVADFDKSIAKSFGVLLPNGNPRRATFLISPNGYQFVVFLNFMQLLRVTDVPYMHIHT